MSDPVNDQPQDKSVKGKKQDHTAPHDPTYYVGATGDTSDPSFKHDNRTKPGQKPEEKTLDNPMEATRAKPLVDKEHGEYKRKDRQDDDELNTGGQQNAI